MQFEDYQRLASVTAIYPNKGNNLYYPALGLGESGEVQNKVKKVMRDHNGIVSEEYRKEISKELGDILWYWFGLTKNLKIDYTRIWNQIYNEQVALDTHKTGGTEILQLVASAGRITEHLKKSIRDDGGKITPERLEKIEQKLAETLELIFVFCQSLNVKPYEVLQKNYDKLFARNEAGTLQGEGDGVTKEERT